MGALVELCQITGPDVDEPTITPELLTAVARKAAIGLFESAVGLPVPRVPVPIWVPPSRNVTVPVGIPVPGAAGETIAVKVTGWPKTDGFADEVTAVVVEA